MAIPIPTHVTVTAPEGRVTPIHPDDGSDLGGRRLFVEPGYICRVRWGQTTRRAWKRGDLVLCDMNGKAVPSAELASSDKDLPGGKICLAERSQPKKGA